MTGRRKARLVVLTMSATNTAALTLFLESASPFRSEIFVGALFLPRMHCEGECVRDRRAQEKCLACSQVPTTLQFDESAKLQDIFDHLVSRPEFQMKAPGMTTTVAGRNKTLYMPSVASIEERTRANLKKTLKELEFVDGQELVVADVTSPMSIVFKVALKSSTDG
uniref:Putative e2 binding domain protein n=1 Tax=Ixodes scapularis TaxID=6945 RepID=A0A4D5RFH4_IXOSC